MLTSTSATMFDISSLERATAYTWTLMDGTDTLGDLTWNYCE